MPAETRRQGENESKLGGRKQSATEFSASSSIWLKDFCRGETRAFADHPGPIGRVDMIWARLGLKIGHAPMDSR